MISLREFVKNNKRFIIAHRGASGTMIENTMPAYEKAVEFGAKVLEIDVQVSKDKIAFAFHDMNLKRVNLDQDTANLSSLDISKINLNTKSDGEIVHIPKLEEVLRFAKQNEVYLVIEIKCEEDNEFVAEDVDVILDVVKSFAYEENCLFASFCKETISYIRSKNNGYNIASIALPNTTPIEMYEEIKFDVYICSIEQLNQQVVDECKKLGVYLGVYSADNEEELDRILKFGINAIVTNYPELISKLLATRDNS